MASIPSFDPSQLGTDDWWHSEPTPERTLQTIVDVAASSLPPLAHVGITAVDRQGRPITTTASDPLVRELDSLQYQVGEGPSLTALSLEPSGVVLVEHACHEARWHHYIPSAVRRGLRSHLGIRLDHDRAARPLGVMNFYFTSSDTIDPETRELAAMFARHTALAYDQARKLHNLTAAVATREVVGKAVGIVMARFDLSDERAFEYLVRVASTTEKKVRVVAEDIVAATNRNAGD